MALGKMFKTTGELQTFVLACKTKTGFWYEERIDAYSAEMARQIVIGRCAPVRCLAAKAAL